MLFPSLVRGVADDVTGKTTCHHWLREEPPGAVYSWARRCWAHARTLCRGITIQFVILLQGHEPFILSNPLFCHSDGGKYDLKNRLHFCIWLEWRCGRFCRTDNSALVYLFFIFYFDSCLCQRGRNTKQINNLNDNNLHNPVYWCTLMCWHTCLYCVCEYVFGGCDISHGASWNQWHLVFFLFCFFCFTVFVFLTFRIKVGIIGQSCLVYQVAAQVDQCVCVSTVTRITHRVNLFQGNSLTKTVYTNWVTLLVSCWLDCISRMCHSPS